MKGVHERITWYHDKSDGGEPIMVVAAVVVVTVVEATVVEAAELEEVEEAALAMHITLYMTSS